MKSSAQLTYKMTQALWTPATRKLLDSGHAKGREIRLETATTGLGIPLHAGAEKVYNEQDGIKYAKSMRLKGKVCVGTAAGQGIGAATARAFAREGATVWATDIDAAKLKALDGVTGIQTRKLDVLDKAAITAFAQETGAVDALFNSAGC